MPGRRQAFLGGQYYHIYHRGADRRRIFFEEDNYLYFLRLVAEYREFFEVGVVAYCLLPNHFHFMLQPARDDTISKFMHRLQVSYVQAINKRYRRRAPLFHERFQDKHVHDDRYQILLCRYIHRNPLKHGLVQSLEDWPFSNYLEFVAARPGKLLLPGFRERFFPSPAAYAAFVAAFGTKEDRELEEWLGLK